MTSKPPFDGEVMRLGDIAKVSAGNVAPKKSAFCDSGKPFVRAGSLSGLLAGGSVQSLERIDDKTAERLGFRLFPAGTVVFAKSGMSCLKDYVYTLPEECYVVSHLACVTPSADLSKYLEHYFNYNRPNRLIENPSFPSIKLSQIEDIQIRLPEKSIRDKQVGRLEAVIDLVDICKDAESRFDDLVKSRFAEMFGDTDALMSRWPRKPLMACVNQIDSGKSVNCKAEARTGSAPGVLKLSALSSGKYLPEENKAMFDSDNVLPGKEVMIGDILVARKNTPDLVGTCVLVDFDAPNLMFPDLVFRMHPIEGVDGTYLSSLLGKSSFSKTVRSLAHGSAKSMSNIPKSELEKLELPLPPLALQREFADFATRVDKLRFVVSGGS